MDSVKLAAFYKSVIEWPRNLQDLGQLAGAVARLLDVPFAAVWVPSIGIRTTEAASQGTNKPSLILAHLERISRSLSIRADEIREEKLAPSAAITSSGQGLAPTVALALECLTAIPIWSGLSTRDALVEHRARQEMGWFIVASERPLSPRMGGLFLAASQHLGDLASIAHLEAAISQRDQFLSIASHELKTPLTSIYGILQLQERMLRPKAQPDSSTPDALREQERQRSFFRIVIRQVERLNELIDGLLNVSRIANGRFAVEPSETDVSAAALDTVNSRLTVIAQEAGVKIETDVEPGIIARVDPVRFEEVVTNLGMNAIRFSPEGGTIRISLSKKDGADGTQEAGFVARFRDQGPRVPDADRARIFQPFERAQRTGRLGGLGLGLFISRQIAQLHGGDVALVESTSRGNIFEARFPLRIAEKIPA